MSCTIRDASLVTLRNRNKAVNSYYTQWQTATRDSSTANSSLVGGPSGAGAEVVAQVKLGCTACTAFTNFSNGDRTNNIQLYPFNPSSGGAGRNGQS